MNRRRNSFEIDSKLILCKISFFPLPLQNSISACIQGQYRVLEIKDSISHTCTNRGTRVNNVFSFFIGLSH